MTSKFAEYLAKKNAAITAQNPLDRMIKITFFAGYAAATKTESTTSLRALMDKLSTTKAVKKDALPWLKLASFGNQKTDRGSFRHDKNVIQIDGVEADYDGEQITVERAKAIITNANLAAIIYTSPSHTDATPRWRVLCPTSKALPPGERARLVARLNGLFVGALSDESFTLSQSYFYGSIEGNASHIVLAVEGRAIDMADDLDAGAVGRPDRRPASPVAQPMAPAPRHAARTSEGGTPYGLAALDDECDAIRRAIDGQKHHTLNKAAFSIGGLVSAGELEEGPAFAALTAALNSIRAACKDFRAAQNTLRTAFADGMGRPRAVPEHQAPAPEEVHPAAAFLAKLATRRAEISKAPIPVAPELMDVEGALKLFIDHCEASAVSPQPFLSLAAGICLIGTLAGRRYQTTTELRTNIYAIGVADSGAGKDHARKQIKKCLYHADLSQYLGGADIASGPGFRTALTRHPAMLFQIDEFGDWLREVVSEKAATHRKQIAAMLKELYSSANVPWQGTEYADQTKNGRPREDIHDPHACFYGTTTPGQFWSAIANASLHDGLMARMLLFVSPCSYPDEREPNRIEPSQELIEALQAVARGAGISGGNLGDLMIAGLPASVMTVPETPEASEARREMRRDQLIQQRESEGTYVTGILARHAENAMKLALIRAVSRNPVAPEIRLDDVNWGKALSQHCVDTLLRDASRNVADSDYERKIQKVTDIIRKHGPITEATMVDRFRLGLSPRDRAEVIGDLIRIGKIVTIEPDKNKPGRKSIKYMIND